jgi:outer membrane protein assembly factor BamB
VEIGLVAGSAALSARQMIYFGSFDGDFHALDRHGNQQWKFHTTGAIGFSAPAIDRDDALYFGSVDGNLYA